MINVLLIICIVSIFLNSYLIGRLIFIHQHLQHINNFLDYLQATFMKNK